MTLIRLYKPGIRACPKCKKEKHKSQIQTYSNYDFGLDARIISIGCTSCVTTCSGCGNGLYNHYLEEELDEDRSECNSCSNMMCDDCSTWCNRCQEPICRGCSDSHNGHIYCPECLELEIEEDEEEGREEAP